MTESSQHRGPMLRVESALASMHGEPRIATAWTSQLPAGHVVGLLDTQRDWCRVRSDDGYEGWVHRGHLADADGTESHWRLSLGCRVQRADGVVIDLPLLARVAPAAQLVDGIAIEPSERATRFPGDTEALVRTATTHFTGASYMWGGVTPWGCDCSGFVQSVHRLHGMALPRDASQQAAACANYDTGTPIDTLPAGALAFFSDRDDRRITHVGIMLGGTRMAHSALARGGFAIDDLADTSDDVVQRLRGNYVGAGTPTAVASA